MMRTGGRAGLWAGLLITAGSLAQVLTLVTIPTLHCAGIVLAGAFGGAATLAVEVAMVAGPAAALAELRGDGTWLGLKTLGTRGRDLAVPALCWAIGLAALALVGSHVVEPQARGWLRDARVEAAVGLRLSEGAATALGPWAVAGDGDGLRFAAEAHEGEIVGGARSARLEAARGAVVVSLGAGEAHTVEPGWSVSFSSLTTVLPVADGPRAQTAERSTSDLLALSGSGALNPYERWILWKRSLIPAVLVPLGALGLPLGARFRAGPGVGALALGFWTVLRLSDTLAQVATGLAAAALLLPALVALCLGWATWRDA